MTNETKLLLCVADAARNVPGITPAHKKAIEHLIGEVAKNDPITVTIPEPNHTAKLTMDMHSTSHNVKFSVDGVLFHKVPTNATFEYMRSSVIEVLVKEIGWTNAQAQYLWDNMEIEHG